MDEATRLRCLEPFFTTEGERGTGLGLGLAMVYGTVQRHGGRVEIDSSPGQGSTVRLVLPVAAQAVMLAELAAAPAPTPIRSLRLLVIDDDPLVLATLAEILQTDAHHVTPAQGGRAGIEAFEAALQRGEPFDAVITDLDIPHVDGRQVALAVKTAHPTTRVLMLTGWGRRMQQDGGATALRAVMGSFRVVTSEVLPKSDIANSNIREAYDCARAFAYIVTSEGRPDAEAESLKGAHAVLSSTVKAVNDIVAALEKMLSTAEEKALLADVKARRVA